MLFWICLFSPLLFFINALVIGWITPDYSARTTAISQLVHYKYGVLQTLNFILCGLLSLGLAYYIQKMNVTTQQEKTLVMVGALAFGLCLILVGTFKTDVGGDSTITGKIHNAAFITSILVQGVVQLLFAMRKFPSVIGSYFLLSGAITLFGLVAMSQFPAIRGLAQRILVLAISIWVTLGPLLVRKT